MDSKVLYLVHCVGTYREPLEASPRPDTVFV
jgi:hypothetical protein